MCLSQRLVSFCTRVSTSTSTTKKEERQDAGELDLALACHLCLPVLEGFEIHTLNPGIIPLSVEVEGVLPRKLR